MKIIAIIWIIITSYIIILPYTIYLINGDFDKCDDLYKWAYNWATKTINNK